MTTPPAPAPAAPAGNGPPPDPAADVAGLTAALEAERERAAGFERELAKLRNANLPDAERAVAEAKAAGRAEALKEAGVRLAAAEFRAVAAGKLADPAAALEVVDLAKFVSDKGEVDSAGLAAVVDKLAGLAPPAPAAPGQVPAGPRGEPDGGGDWLRAGLRGTIR